MRWWSTLRTTVSRNGDGGGFFSGLDSGSVDLAVWFCGSGALVVVKVGFVEVRRRRSVGGGFSPTTTHVGVVVMRGGSGGWGFVIWVGLPSSCLRSIWYSGCWFLFIFSCLRLLLLETHGFRPLVMGRRSNGAVMVFAISDDEVKLEVGGMLVWCWI
jgi:hypothetical protein